MNEFDATPCSACRTPNVGCAHMQPSSGEGAPGKTPGLFSPIRPMNHPETMRKVTMSLLLFPASLKYHVRWVDPDGERDRHG